MLHVSHPPANCQLDSWQFDRYKGVNSASLWLLSILGRRQARYSDYCDEVWSNVEDEEVFFLFCRKKSNCTKAGNINPSMSGIYGAKRLRCHYNLRMYFKYSHIKELVIDFLTILKISTWDRSQCHIQFESVTLILKWNSMLLHSFFFNLWRDKKLQSSKCPL